MKEKKLNILQLHKYIFPVFIVAIVWALMAYLFDFYYDTNDDIMLKDIMNGAYTGTPNGYNIYMLFPLSLGISVLYRIIPGIPWFGLFLTGSVAVSGYFVIARIYRMMPAIWCRVLAIFTLITIFFGMALFPSVYIQYSFAASILASAGGFLLITSKGDLTRKQFIIDNIPAIILIVLGFMLRSQMVLLIGPMILMAGIIGWYNGAKGDYKPVSKEGLIKYGIVALIIALLMILSMGIHKLAYIGVDWKAFNDYNSVRTELFDFQQHVPLYEEHKEFYDELELKQEEVVLFGLDDIGLDDNFDIDTLEKIVEYNDQVVGIKYFKASFKDSIAQYVWKMTHKKNYPWVLMAWVMYGLCVFASIYYKKIEIAWQLPLMIVARTIGWMYPLMRGRILPRIMDSLYCCEVLIVFGLLISIIVNAKKNSRGIAGKNIIVVFLIFAFIMLYSVKYSDININDTLREKEIREKQNVKWSEISDYCNVNPDSYYVVDVSSAKDHSYKIYMKENTAYKNYEICGGWSVNSPIYFDKLNNRNIDSIEQALINNSNVYFAISADKDIEWLIDYYEAKGRIVTAKEIKRFSEEGFVIYKLSEN